MSFLTIREDTMDAAGTALLALLTGLNVAVGWCVWHRRPRRPRRGWGAWLRGRLWWHLAGLHSAVWALIWRLHRWAQRRPLRVRFDARLSPPCVLCGDARHTAQAHVRRPLRELERRDGRQGGPGEGH